MVTPAAKREAVAHLRIAFKMSERRACRIIGCVRMSVRYRTRRPSDTELRERLRKLANERRRFGYRRLQVLLRREGRIVNHKRLFRLYREERLSVRRRGGRKRALGTRAPLAVPRAPNERWSLDFVSDQFRDGRRLRILAVVDDCTRECLARLPKVQPARALLGAPTCHGAWARFQAARRDCVDDARLSAPAIAGPRRCVRGAVPAWSERHGRGFPTSLLTSGGDTMDARLLFSGRRSCDVG